MLETIARSIELGCWINESRAGVVTVGCESIVDVGGRMGGLVLVAHELEHVLPLAGCEGCVAARVLEAGERFGEVHGGCGREGVVACVEHGHNVCLRDLGGVL